jgi:phosphoribosyl 1,2-cyclic phosphodiesterase
MQVRFFGVRGSVPWATPDSIGYGCNTPCVLVTDPASSRVLVLDAGSGIVGVGAAVSDQFRALPILLTHYHWDHLQGLPFFGPFYQQGRASTIWAPCLPKVDLAWVDTIFQSPFYPVPYDQLPSRPGVSLVYPAETEIGGFRIGVQRLNHPGGAFAYRIHGETGDLVYATDHEFGDAKTDDELGRFARGARAVILDAHFTPDELPSHIGWGHGSWSQCAEFAAAHDIGRLWLFHHKPGRSDAEMKDIEERARQVFPATDAAREGTVFEV